ncbi:hypothetical protein [Streptomyces sp. NPDC004788]
MYAQSLVVPQRLRLPERGRSRTGHRAARPAAGTTAWRHLAQKPGAARDVSGVVLPVDGAGRR